ncbi:lytic transglycosylase domain-containing protein [Alteriqipengyuania lutimaris]|uniref:Lytic transglycosylase domain-containing protein n=1 Tax=Alteriqipengyuania lutimaris TaxID=1538146 RepID=A0A395LL11_9SPHN|nr:lytic transglycosylase domain-containing protein [Alteriqipengyuania lutimaris]
MRASIARASQSTGVDFDYLLAQARLESGLDPDAKARTSSATGLYQFIDSTWLRTMDRHGSKYGLGWAADQINPGGGVANAGTRSQLLSLRYDADVSALMAAELARDNSNGLQGFLGREPDATEMYLAHFLGLGGAQKFLGAYRTDAGQSAAALMPKAASANRAIFYDGGRQRSVAEVMSLMQTKVADAMDRGGAMPFAPGSAPGAGGITEEFAAARYASTAMMPGRATRTAAAVAPAGPAQRPSMADTLRSTFGTGDIGGRARARIDEAYGKFAAFGL